jgi:ribosome maturation protein Sdo1
MSRKTRRAMKKIVGAKAQEKMAEQVAQFGKLPQSCDACHKEFDKKNKSMVQSWNVVVRQENVRLFCPDCIEKTKEIINEHC